MDFCGTVANEATLEFYYDTNTQYGRLAQCKNRKVAYDLRFNDLWWETAGNARRLNNELLCARIDGTDNIIVR